MRTMTRKKSGKLLVMGGTPRVNLLPPKEVENRARKELRMQWLKAFISAFLLIAMPWTVGLQWNAVVHSQLEANVEESEQLQSQLAEYSEVIHLQSNVRNLNALRTQAGSNDQNWEVLTAQIRSVLPAGVALIGFTLVPGAAPVPGSDASAAVGLKGTLTFSAKATSAQADTITRLRTVKTFIDVDASELSSNGPGGGFTFVTTFSADQTGYTGRFVQAGSR